MELYSKDSIAGRIARIVRVSGRVDREIHLINCSVLSHTIDSGDYTAIEPMMNGLPNGQRKQAIALWFKKFSGGQLSLTVNAKTKIWSGSLKGPDGTKWDKKLFDLAGGCAISFGDLTRDKAETVFDMERMVDWLTAKAQNTDKNDNGTFKVTIGTRDLAAKVLATIIENGWNNPKLVEADKLVSGTAPILASLPHKTADDKVSELLNAQDDALAEMQKLLAA